jgi:uncharacterized protein GlcG (DUF336 family)
MKRFFSIVFAAMFAATLHAQEQLTQADVQLIVAQAVTAAAKIDPSAIVAVVDREGFILALWDVKGRLPSPLPAFPNPPNGFPKGSLVNPPFGSTVKLYALVGGAVTRAISAAFLSSGQNAFTSRTAGYIIQQHFPVGVRDTSNGPLVGVGLSSLFFTDVNTAKLIPPGFDGSAPVASTISPGVRKPAVPLVLTTLSDSPGGVPLYKHGALVGGIGVTGDGSPTDLNPAGAILFDQVQHDFTSGFKAGHDTDEDVALAGQTGFEPSSDILATNVLIGGIRIPYVAVNASPPNVDNAEPLGTIGRSIDIPVGVQLISGAPQASPAPYPFQVTELGGTVGEIRFPIRDDPQLNTPGRQLIGGRARRLTATEVTSILAGASHQNAMTRAGIRLPIGTPAKNFIVVVNNPDKAGQPPDILGIFRTGEATIFSWDVAAQKARTAVFFSNSQLAMSSRSIGFLSQRWFPPGIDGQPPGPFFGFQEAVSLKRNPKGGFPGDPNLPNGITIFPGGFPLYRSGQVVGAIGVSGDGIDQDDLIAAAGTVNFLASQSIRADSYTYHGARLPYAKFPRDPNIP